MITEDFPAQHAQTPTPVRLPPNDPIREVDEPPAGRSMDSTPERELLQGPLNRFSSLVDRSALDTNTAFKKMRKKNNF